MNRTRTGMWAVAAAILVAVVVSGKVYGTSLRSDAGNRDGSATTTAAVAPSLAATTVIAVPQGPTSVSDPAVAATAGGTTCPGGLPGPDLVFIGAPVPYCIDAREVTQGQYGDFLKAASAAPPTQPERCKWNDRFEPIPHSYAKAPNGEIIDDPPETGSCPAGVFDPVARFGEAVRCVDWCDARAYCAWAGKRLCGAVGPKPAIDRAALVRNPTLTEFQYACTGGGAHAYPYGDAYVAGKCVDPNAVDPVGQGSAACAGAEPPFNHIRDLLGNVFEWQDDCDASGDHCLMQGGYFTGPGVMRSCADSGSGFYSHETHENIGIRCCADAVTP